MLQVRNLGRECTLYVLAALQHSSFCLNHVCGRGMMLTPHPLLVPWSRKNRTIPLLSLWAVQPVQSLSACTRVHFTFFFMFHNVTNQALAVTALFWGQTFFQRISMFTCMTQDVIMTFGMNQCI